MVMYSTEITALAALLIGLGIGALIFNERGKDKADSSFVEGYSLGREVYRPKRDRNGRFKCR